MMTPRGQNYALRARFHFPALCPLAPTPFDLATPNLVQGCGVTRSFNAKKFRGVGKLGGQNFDFSENYDFDYFFALTGLQPKPGESEIPNFQGRCALVWFTCHVSDDPERSKLCPQGTIPFSSLMPSSSDTL